MDNLFISSFKYLVFQQCERLKFDEDQHESRNTACKLCI